MNYVWYKIQLPSYIQIGQLCSSNIKKNGDNYKIKLQTVISQLFQAYGIWRTVFCVNVYHLPVTCMWFKLRSVLKSIFIWYVKGTKHFFASYLRCCHKIPGVLNNIMIIDIYQWFPNFICYAYLTTLHCY